MKRNEGEQHNLFVLVLQNQRAHPPRSFAPLEARPGADAPDLSSTLGDSPAAAAVSSALG
eukprot:SAG22_NODE_2022_length_3123_cov_12.497354_5_plen_60_part_00